MRRAFVYEIRRNLLALAIFCVAAVAVAAVMASVTNLSARVPLDDGMIYGVRLRTACVGTFAVILCVLCAIVPVMQFSYRMKMRSADLWYSLPVRRTALVFVRTAVGLALVFVPYTLAFWTGVGIAAMRETGFAFVHYLSCYAASLPLGIGLFGINAFLFTRGNTVADGLVFLAGWSCVLPLAVCSLGAIGILGDPYVGTAGNLFPYSSVTWTFDYFDALICRRLPAFGTTEAAAYIFPIVAAEAAGAYTALFVCARRDRAESAEQISASWMGYRVLVPMYVALFTALNGTDQATGLFWIFLVLIVLFGFAGFAAYRRSFRLKPADLVSFAGALALGLLLIAIDACI